MCPSASILRRKGLEENGDELPSSLPEDFRRCQMPLREYGAGGFGRLGHHNNQPPGVREGKLRSKGLGRGGNVPAPINRGKGEGRRRGNRVLSVVKNTAMMGKADKKGRRGDSMPDSALAPTKDSVPTCDTMLTKKKMKKRLCTWRPFISARVPGGEVLINELINNAKGDKNTRMKT